MTIWINLNDFIWHSDLTTLKIFIENKSKLVYIFKQLYFCRKRLATTRNYKDALWMCSSLENKNSYKILKMNENQLKSMQYRFCIRYFILFGRIKKLWAWIYRVCIFMSKIFLISIVCIYLKLKMELYMSKKKLTSA